MTDHEEHRRRSARSVGVAIVVISDSRDPRTDESGRAARSLLEGAGHRIREQSFMGNDAGRISNAIRSLANKPGVDVILTLGGTGISKRDVTIEALSPLMEKSLPGFGELFRGMSSEQIGTAAVMSRSTAGVVSGKVVICLPGSPKAVELAVSRIIIPEVGHMVFEASR